MNSLDALAALKAETGFQPLGEAVGNLTLGRGAREGRPLHVAIVENRIASGSLGIEECDKLASLFRIVAAQRGELAIYLDSAGARVSQGLPALGAFRHMYRHALAMSLTGARMTTVIGANCFGGASMLAALAGARRYSDNSQLAMSGPSILAQAAGGSALDDMFRAIAQANIGCDARTRLGDGEERIEAGWPAGGAIDARVRHASLGARLSLKDAPAEALQRKDLALLFPEGYELTEQAGLVSGRARTAAGDVVVLGVLNRQAMSAATAWRWADRVWRMLDQPPPALRIVIDCETHSASLDDEKVMLSSYLADLALALAALGRAGTLIETNVLGKLGGGIYVALAAASAQLHVVYGGHIQLLPGKAIASILGDSQDQKHEIEDYRAARVAEQELRIGLVPQ